MCPSTNRVLLYAGSFFSTIIQSSLINFVAQDDDFLIQPEVIRNFHQYFKESPPDGLIASSISPRSSAVSSAYRVYNG